MIKKCVCEDYRSDAAEYQNQTYGAGMRVFNPRGGKNRGGFRCTVCGAESQGNGGAVAAPKKAA